MKQYEVLSPDGFGIEMESDYKTLKEAKAALQVFIDRYKQQGYYSTFRNGERYKMPISDIKKNCKIITINI